MECFNAGLAVEDVLGLLRFRSITLKTTSGSSVFHLIFPAAPRIGPLSYSQRATLFPVVLISLCHIYIGQTRPGYGHSCGKGTDGILNGSHVCQATIAKNGSAASCRKRKV